MKERRYKILWVSQESITSLLLNWKRRTVLSLPYLEDLPSDCEVVHTFFSHEKACFGIILEHSSFEIVVEGGEPPSVSSRIVIFEFYAEGDGEVIGLDADVAIFRRSQ